MHGILLFKFNSKGVRSQTGAKCKHVCMCVRVYNLCAILHFHLFISSIHRFSLYRHVGCRNNYDKTGKSNKHWTLKVTEWKQGFSFKHNTSLETTGSDLHHITSGLNLIFLSFFFFNRNNCIVHGYQPYLPSSPLIPPFWSTVSLWYQQIGCQRKIA